MTRTLTKSLGILGVTISTALAAPNNSELKIGISQEFENLNPMLKSMVATTYILGGSVRGLVYIDADGKWAPQMAKEIPTIEKGSAKVIDVGGNKKVVATWELQDKASWGDGKPVTCADYDFALKVAASNNVSVAEKESYTQVEKIEWDAKTPKKCIFTYAKARWDFYQLGSFIPVPKHLEEAVFTKHGGQKEGYEKNTTYVKNPTNPGLYNGPYLVSDVKLGDHVTMVPNPNYWGPAPKIKRIIIKYIPNTGTLEANLRSGTIDMIATLGLAFDQALAFDKKVKSENLPYVVSFTPSITYEHIDLNTENPILADINVRKALAVAINREDLTKALFEGKQIPALHFISPKDPWFSKDPAKVVNYRYSKREAAKILDDAGWKIGADGYRSKNGKRLSLTLMSTAGNKTRELVEVYLQEQWKQVGIEVLIKNEPARVFFSETTRHRKFDAMAMFAWMSAPEANPISTLHSKNIPAEKNGWSGQNFMAWKNKTVDQILNDLEVEFNAQKRLSLVADLQKEYTADIPVLPLYYRSDVSAVPKNLKNFRVPGHQYPETNDVEKWSLE